MAKGKYEIQDRYLTQVEIPCKVAPRLRPVVTESRYLCCMQLDNARNHISATLIFWYVCEKYESVTLAHPYSEILIR